MTIKKNRKGIILAGGTGTRLFPVTVAVSKQLLPIYDKPMVYYPLSTLMLAGIREVLLISTPQDLTLYRQLLGNGHQWGMQIEYAVQPKPEGIPQALIIAQDFLAGEACALILGDNVFYGHEFTKKLKAANEQQKGATIFAYGVKDPERYGVLTCDAQNKPLHIQEKPLVPQSNHAITGLYFLDHKAGEIARGLRPSQRGELEIIDVLQHYLDSDQLHVNFIGRGYTWLDAGTADSLLEAASFIAAIQKRQGYILACPEEIALMNGWVSPEALGAWTDTLGENAYGQYVMSLLRRFKETESRPYDMKTPGAQQQAG